MNKEQVKEIFNKLSFKQRKVLEGFVKDHLKEKIKVDADIPSDGALQQHLRQLYKAFKIDTRWNDADDKRSGERKRSHLLALIRDAMPELVGNSPPSIANKRQDLGFELQKPIEECGTEIQRLENVGLIRHEASVDLLEAVKRNAKDARKALEPDILERIRRPIVFEHCLTEIWRGVKEGKRRVIPILGDADRAMN